MFCNGARNLFKEVKMKQIKLNKLFSWGLAHISWITMAFSPVALGKESENLTAENLKAYSAEFGLNQKTTLADFWEKSKAYYPGYMYKEIESFVQKNPNMPMPQFEIKTSKSSNGEDVPTIYISENGKTQTIQIFGKPDKFVKMNDVYLSENEIGLPKNIAKKLLAADPKLKLKYSEAKASEKARTSPFPQMDSKLWKKMTFEQRVTYFIQMRMMYIDAQKVLSEKNKDAEKKSSAFPTFEYIFKSILPDVDAATAKKKTQAKTSKVSVSDTCIVAGYVGRNVSKVENDRGQRAGGCSVDAALNNYSAPEVSFVKTSNETCATKSKSSIACNPIIYGTPNGQPICVDKKSSEFQIATHWEGPCDTQSRLSHNHPLFDLNGKDYSQIQPREKQIEVIRKDQAEQNFQLTKDFIAGVLASKDQALLALFKDGKWSDQLEKEIKKIGDSFNEGISAALADCESKVTLPQIDKRQRPACDQLHRRYLFIDEVIGGLKKDIEPVVALPPPQLEPADKVEPKPKKEPAPVEERDVSGCGKPNDIANYDYKKCNCTKGELEVSNAPGKIAKFFGAKSPEPGTEKYECDSGPNWWLIGAGALGIIGLIALLSRHKKSDKPKGTATTCLNGGTPPACTIPTTCANGGMLPDCKIPTTCSNGGTPPACTIPTTCANTCTLPAVINPMSCVCTAPPSEGGTGVNTCLTGTCSGGVPTAQ